MREQPWHFALGNEKDVAVKAGNGNSNSIPHQIFMQHKPVGLQFLAKRAQIDPIIGLIGLGSMYEKRMGLLLRPSVEIAGTIVA